VLWWQSQSGWCCTLPAGGGQALEHLDKAAPGDKICEDECWEDPIPDREVEDIHAAYTCTCQERQSCRLCSKCSSPESGLGHKNQSMI